MRGSKTVPEIDRVIECAALRRNEVLASGHTAEIAGARLVLRKGFGREIREGRLEAEISAK